MVRGRLLSLALASVLSPLGFGQFLIKPKGEDSAAMDMKTLQVRASIDHGLVESTTLMTFANPVSFRQEVDFIAKVPDGAALVGFAYWYGEEKVPAFVTERARAASIYDAITTRQQDPALIEMIGPNTYRIRIFPVEPNTDLKIELKQVQPLKDWRYVIPLPTKQKAPLADLDVEVSLPHLDGVLVQNSMGRNVENKVIRHRVQGQKPSRDLAIMVKPEGAKAVLHSGRSGGPIGFFVMTARLEEDGPYTISVSGVPTQQLIGSKGSGKAGQLVTLTGRYTQPGDGLVSIKTKRTARSYLLPFSNDVVPNLPASRYWASRQIMDWGKNPRFEKEASALSHRFSIPSHWTSWLAIPTAERQRFKEEIERSDYTALIAKYLEAAGSSSRDEAKLKAELQAHPGAKKYEWWLNRMVSETYYDYRRAQMGQERETKFTQTQLNRIVKKTAWVKIDREEITDNVLQNMVFDWQQEVTDAILRGDTSGREYRIAMAKLRHNERKYKADFVKSAEGNAIESLAYARGREISKKRYGEFASNSGYEVTSIQKALRARPRIRPAVEARASELASEWFFNETYHEFNRMKDFDPSSPEAQRLRKRFALFNESQRKQPDYWVKYKLRDGLNGRGPTEEQLLAVGVPEPVVRSSAKAAREEHLQALQQRLSTEHYRTIRDREAIARLESSIKNEARRLNVDPTPFLKPERGSTYYHSENRDALVDALRRGDEREIARLQKLVADERSWRGDEKMVRIEVIKKEVQIDLLLDQPLTEDEQILLARYQAEAKQLRARMGDPLILISAPRSAKSVIATLPSGEVKVLEWDEARGCWVGRFDIPAYVTEGDYRIQVQVQRADGKRENHVVTYKVDLSKPTLTVQQFGRRIIVEGVADLARVELITSDQQRLSFEKIAEGRFQLSLPEGVEGGTLVATDRAHNRTQQEFTWSPR